MSEENHSIAGGWLGSYYYGKSAPNTPPVRFEATFSLPGSTGKFTGKILDDDGGGGEAGVSGVQAGRGVRFTKAYLPPRGNKFSLAVEYDGEMAEDGKRMTGTWKNSDIGGNWEAHRLWSPQETEEAVTETAELTLPPRELQPAR